MKKLLITLFFTIISLLGFSQSDTTFYSDTMQIVRAVNKTSIAGAYKLVLSLDNAGEPIQLHIYATGTSMNMIINIRGGISVKQLNENSFMFSYLSVDPRTCEPAILISLVQTEGLKSLAISFYDTGYVFKINPPTKEL